MERQIPLTCDLVLIGGGHAGALAPRMWGMKPLSAAPLPPLLADGITDEPGARPLCSGCGGAPPRHGGSTSSPPTMSAPSPKTPGS